MDRGTVGLVGTVKDEGPWLIEWLAHNKAIGFDKIAVASNDCSDGSDLILDRLQEMGVLKHHRNKPPYGNNIQHKAYRELQNLPEMKRCEWLMPLDIDEFLNIHVGSGTVQELTTRAGSSHWIMVRWRVFGDSGLSGFVPIPVTDFLTQAAKNDAPCNYYFKTITRTHRLYWLGIHMTTVWKRFVKFTPLRFVRLRVFCDGEVLLYKQRGNMREFVEQALNAHSEFKLAQVNHYAVRTRELLRLKNMRGRADRYQQDHADQGYFDGYNYNDVEDRSIQRYAHARNELMKAWLSDEKLKKLHLEAIEFSKARMAECATT